MPALRFTTATHLHSALVIQWSAAVVILQHQITCCTETPGPNKLRDTAPVPQRRILGLNVGGGDTQRRMPALPSCPRSPPILTTRGRPRQLCAPSTWCGPPLPCFISFHPSWYFHEDSLSTRDGSLGQDMFSICEEEKRCSQPEGT